MKIILRPKEILYLLRLEFPEYDFESSSRKIECTYIRYIYYKYAYREKIHTYDYVGSLLKRPQASGSVRKGIKVFEDLHFVKDPIFLYFHKRALTVLEKGKYEESKEDMINKQQEYINLLIKRINQINKRKKRRR